MGNPSNLTTLRTNSELKTSEFDTKKFLVNLLISKYFEKSLKNKNIFVHNCEVSKTLNTLHVNMFCFFNTKKMSFYRSSVNKKKRRIIRKKRHPLSFFRSLDSKFKMIVFSIKTLNKFVNTENLLLFYVNFKKFRGQLFGRKLNLFYDFLKITSLFVSRHLNVNSFLYYISQLFCFLIKKKHNSFLFFLKTLFQLLISQNKYMLSGLKFLISGKISGKTRSSTHKILVGSVPLQSFNKNIKMAKSHVYTIYGVFGFKLWVCEKNNYIN
jgi:hypothetical protein